MASCWKANETVTDLAQELIGKHFPDLALIDKKIGFKFKEKAGKASGMPKFCSVSKAPPILDVFGDGDYEFIVEIAYDIWINVTDQQREACLYHCLSHMAVEEDLENPLGYKCSLNRPDVPASFRDEIDLYGAWHPTYDQIKAAQKRTEGDE